MNNSFLIIADVILFKAAERAFKFPIKNNIRVSIWFTDEPASRPSEFIVTTQIITIDTLTRLKIEIAKWNLSGKKIHPNSKFFIGPYCNEIGEGIISEVLES